MNKTETKIDALISNLFNVNFCQVHFFFVCFLFFLPVKLQRRIQATGIIIRDQTAKITFVHFFFAIGNNSSFISMNIQLHFFLFFSPRF